MTIEYSIEVDSLSKRYENAFVLDDVSTKIPQGQIIGLLGHNGAGKSTLIKLIIGLIAPTAGQVQVLGGTPHGPASHSLRARIGYLPENATFYANLTGIEVINYLAKLKKTAKGQGRSLLDRMGLANAMNRRISTYSKGMRQRLGLAQALLGAPELLLLDEPTTGLDPMATLDFFNLISELREQGKTVLISSHLLAELEPHLDGAVILGEGRVLAQGTMAQMREAAGLPIIISARFSSNVNYLKREQWLMDLANRVQVHSSQHIELDVPLHNKMVVVRHLMNVPALVDITVKEPTLARLYATVGSDQFKN